MTAVILFTFGVLGISAALTPTIIAFWRGHPARWRIATFNLFSPYVGSRRWLAALMWSISDKDSKVRETMIY